MIVPSLPKAGRSLASDSADVSLRTPSSLSTTIGSPLRCGTSTGITSSAKTPFFQAAAACWCERALNSSCSSRLSLRPVLFAWSVRAPMAWSVNASHSPSNAIESTSVVSPYLKPSRDFGSRCGAFVIDSIPPATTISYSPARISWSARAIAFRPDRQTLLMVMAGIVIGMPPLVAAWRAVI